MVNTIQKKLSKYPRIWNLAQLGKMFVSARHKPADGKKKLYPKVIQLPLTYKCNSKCIMCNIWQMDHSNEIGVEEFAGMLQDPLFAQVESVGINGGEPSLIKELPSYAAEILKLPNLKSLNIISHGFNKKALWPKLEEIYAQCKEKGIYFHVSISLDGYDDIHNVVRGMPVFKMTDQTIKEVQGNKEKYCDSIDVGCTIMRQNVDYLIELDTYAKQNDFDIKYRMGIENKRIESDKLVSQYSLFYDKSIQSAKEFFHSRFFEAKTFKDKFKYYSIFHFLTAKKKERLLGCHWQEEGITMDSRGDLYYCAVASDKIGSLREEKGEDIFFSEKNLEYRQSILDHNCNDCIHDYHGKANFSNILLFFKAYLSEQFYWAKYYLKLKMPF